MTSRITFLLVALFWVTMTYLLWRSEYVGHNQAGSSVPIEVVWRKILTAPDNSSLEILHHDKRVGYCQWASSIGQELASGRVLTDEIPSGGVKKNADGYRLSFEGNVAFTKDASRLGFESEFKLATNEAWQELAIRLKMKPAFWEIRSVATEKSVRFTAGDQDGRTERLFHFSDLQNPQLLMQDFDMPSAMALTGIIGPLMHSTNASSSPLSLGIKWTARNDWISIGHTAVRAYRVEAALLDRYRMRVIVSRVGEILRVDLPDGWELVNGQLINL